MVGRRMQGVLALGGLSWTGETTIINGTVFRRATMGFISFNPFASCNFGNNCNVKEITTHELGHAIGLGHSEFFDATMWSIAHFDGRCASVRADDVNGALFMYPAGAGGGGPLSIVTTTLTGGLVGTPYTSVLIAAGGTAPYSWSLVSGSGSLPPGLELKLQRHDYRHANDSRSLQLHRARYRRRLCDGAKSSLDKRSVGKHCAQLAVCYADCAYDSEPRPVIYSQPAMAQYRRGDLGQRI